MNDPSRLDISDWFAAIAAGIIAGIVAGLAGAFAWFRSSKNRLYMNLGGLKEDFTERINILQKDHDRRHDKVELQIGDLRTLYHQHAVQMERLATTQANITSGLDDLKKEGREQNRKLDRILQNGHHADND